MTSGCPERGCAPNGCRFQPRFSEKVGPPDFQKLSARVVVIASRALTSVASVS
jgi:hypothetical protein